MVHLRHALFMALCSVLVLGACAGKGRDEGTRLSAAAPPNPAGAPPDPAAAPPADPPGATRAELARVPEQFPLPNADPTALDASVGEDNGRQMVTLRFAAEGRPAANALLLSDHLSALGWRIEAVAPSDNGSSFRFEGFGWSGQALFKPGNDRSADAVIELRQTG